MPLAGLEAAIAVPAVFERFPMTVATSPDALGHLDSSIFNGYRTLPVSLNED
ncbi:hypothetical protein [Amycolatopsis sp. NPDC059657]|uniref:hypothetical protein n=1 Tax=Amycolatopsis sp. NPDC059657 TaxID=3346899 RepID=UPI003671E3D4